MLQCSRVSQHPHTHQAPAIYGNITLASSACSYACAVIGMHQFCMFHCWHKASLLQQLQLLTPPQPNRNSRGTVTVHTDKPDDAITITLTVQNDSKSAHHFEASTIPFTRHPTGTWSHLTLGWSISTQFVPKRQEFERSNLQKFKCLGVRFFIQEKNQYLVFSLSLLTNDFLTSRIWFKPHAGKEVLHGVIAKIIRDRTKFKQISLQERKREEYQFCKCTYTTTRLIGINLNIAFYQRGCDLIGYRTRCL